MAENINNEQPMIEDTMPVEEIAAEQPIVEQTVAEQPIVEQPIIDPITQQEIIQPPLAPIQPVEPVPPVIKPEQDLPSTTESQIETQQNADRRYQTAITRIKARTPNMAGTPSQDDIINELQLMEQEDSAALKLEKERQGAVEIEEQQLINEYQTKKDFMLSKGYKFEEDPEMEQLIAKKEGEEALRASLDARQKEELQNAIDKASTPTEEDILIKQAPLKEKRAEKEANDRQIASEKKDLEDFKQKTENDFKAVQDALDKYRDHKIDSGRYLRDMDTGPKVLMAIALAMSSYGSAITKTEDTAFKMLQDAINKDVEQQIEAGNVKKEHAQLLLSNHYKKAAEEISKKELIIKDKESRVRMNKMAQEMALKSKEYENLQKQKIIQKAILEGKGDDVPIYFLDEGAQKQARELNNTYRSEIDKIGIGDMLVNLETMQRNIEENSGPADASLIYLFYKTFDPTSVVREGEFKTLKDIGAFLETPDGMELNAKIPSSLKRLVAKMTTGEMLTKQQKQNLIKSVVNKNKATLNRVDKVNKEFTKLSRSYGIPSKAVVTKGYKISDYTSHSAKAKNEKNIESVLNTPKYKNATREEAINALKEKGLWHKE